jgi:lipopolysaccharide biosynthesis protein
MPERLGRHYDIVGHLHGKKSGHVETAVGDRWRNFAWQHLLGNKYPMLDIIAAAFADHPNIGLVFPEDPHLNGWDLNEAIGIELARRISLTKPLPTHFDFPIGTMFWARPEALKPLFEMKLDLSEIPAEPLPIDGTILHALERLIPFAVEKAGFAYATTHVAGVNR